MNTVVKDPATNRELARYIEREHPDLDTSYNARCGQLVVVGQPGKPEPSAALHEILGSNRFELQASAVASRGRRVGVVTAGDSDGGDR